MLPSQKSLPHSSSSHLCSVSPLSLILSICIFFLFL
jgi:hypothetical protein